MKNKNFLTILAGVFAGLLVLFTANPAKALETHVNDLNSAAWGWGNYSVAVDYKDLTDTNGLTFTQSFTTRVFAAKQAIKCVAVALVKPFSTVGATNGNNTLTLQIGDSNGVNQFASSTELNVAGTEVYFKYGNSTSIAYTAANSLLFKFTGQTNYAMNVYTQGEVRAFFQVYDVTTPDKIP